MSSVSCLCSCLSTLIKTKQEVLGSKNVNVILWFSLLTHLPEMRVSQRTFGLWVDYDDPDSWQNL